MSSSASSWPCAASLLARCSPKKPAPPVMSTFILLSDLHSYHLIASVCTLAEAIQPPIVYALTKVPAADCTPGAGLCQITGWLLGADGALAGEHARDVVDQVVQR